METGSTLRKEDEYDVRSREQDVEGNILLRREAGVGS
jgi:hypothetical protein